MEMNYNKMFSKETKILISDMVKYTLNHKNKKNFLFPVLLYKVVLPNLTKKELNFFQKTILEILSFQNASSDFISKKLLLNEDLVKYIFNELKDKGYYKNGLVTESGKKVLRNIYEPSETIIGYCIYDLLCERVMDYFILENDLESMQIEHSFYNGNSADLQKKISERGYKAYIIKTVNDEIDEIDIKNEDIYKAYMNYIKNYKEYFIKDVQSMADSSIIDKIDNKIAIDKIKIISMSPTPYYLTTYLYYNSSNVNKGILVSDPFFDKVYFQLNDFIENYRNRYDNIREMYEELSPSKISDLDIVKKSEEKIIEFEKTMYNIFEKDFIKNHKKLIEESFYNLFNSYKLLITNDIETLNVSTKMKSQEDFIECLNKAFEYIFHYNIFNMGYNIKVNNVLSSDLNLNTRILTKIALDIGFDNENNVIESFFYKVYNGRIFSKNGILKGNIEDIVSLSAVNLLVSLNNKNFNFANLAKEYDNLFTMLLEINNIRVTKYHDDFKNLNNGEIIKYFKYFVCVFSVLFNTNINYKCLFDININKKIENYEDYKNELESATCEVTNIFGNNIKYYPALFEYLVSMQYNLNNNYDVYIKTAKIFENIFKIMIEQLGLENVFNSVREELMKNDKSFIDNIESYLISIGFNMDNKFPEFLLDRWKENNAYKATLKKHLLFSDLLMILVIYSQLNPDDDILKKIAKVEPNFINYSLRYGNRHHNTALSNDKHILNFDNYKYAVDKTYSSVKAVIDIIKNN